MTKDTDFVDSFWLQRKPHKLLLVSTGNITNKELEAVIVKNLKWIAEAFESYDFLEIDQSMLTIHT